MSTESFDFLTAEISQSDIVTFAENKVNLKREDALLALKLEGTGMTEKDFSDIAEAMAETKARPYSYTCSDITQRFVPSLVLAAYPEHKITKALALRVVEDTPASPPFTAE